MTNHNYEPKSLYELALNVTCTVYNNLIIDLPQTINADISKRIFICYNCKVTGLTERFLITRTNESVNRQNYFICHQCIYKNNFKCWACLDTIKINNYKVFKEQYESMSAFYESPIMTIYNFNKKEVILCFKCDGFFWPCDDCGIWINYQCNNCD